MTDPLEKALDELIEAVHKMPAWKSTFDGDNWTIHYDERDVIEKKRLILSCAMWIGDDDDCECLPDGEPCAYCRNKYKQQKARKENVSDTR